MQSNRDTMKRLCELARENATEIKALLNYNSNRMEELNRERIVATIDITIENLEEIKRYFQEIKQ